MKLTKTEKCIFFLLLALGIFVRLYRFGSAPPGLNQDEAFAAYDAWALLHYGADSSLHRFPVYLTAWGSGMNALESYLMIPFLALFGVKTWVIRLPQLLLALCALPAAFSVGRRLGGKRGGLCALAVLSLCPWHILLSRWALESNMAPNLLLLGLCFFLKGKEDGRFLPVSALCYGLALYAYSAIWPVMPLLLGLMLVYLRPKADRWLLGSGVILAVLALPLVGFLAVNYGLVDEFSIGPFSVPRLVQMRSGEISLSHVPDNLKTMLRILLTQSDGLKWNSAGRFGLFYPAALPFGLLGLGALVYRSFTALRDRRYDPAVLLLVWLFTGVVSRHARRPLRRLRRGDRPAAAGTLRPRRRGAAACGAAYVLRLFRAVLFYRLCPFPERGVHRRLGRGAGHGPPARRHSLRHPRAALPEAAAQVGDKPAGIQRHGGIRILPRPVSQPPPLRTFRVCRRRRAAL